MRVRLSLLAALCGAALFLAPQSVTRLQAQDGWISLYDGKSLDGWKVGENAATFSVQDGAIVTKRVYLQPVRISASICRSGRIW